MGTRHTSWCKQGVEQKRCVVGYDVSAAGHAAARVRARRCAAVASRADVVAVTPPDGRVAREAVADEVAASDGGQGRWQRASKLVVRHVEHTEQQRGEGDGTC